MCFLNDSTQTDTEEKKTIHHVSTTRIELNGRRGSEQPFGSHAQGYIVRGRTRSMLSMDQNRSNGIDWSRQNKRDQRNSAVILRPVNTYISSMDDQRERPPTIIRHNALSVHNFIRAGEHLGCSTPRSRQTSTISNLESGGERPRSVVLGDTLVIGDMKQEEKEEYLSSSDSTSPTSPWDVYFDNSSGKDTFTGLYPFLNRESELADANFGNILEEVYDTSLSSRLDIPTFHIEQVENKQREIGVRESTSVSIELLLPLHNEDVRGAKWHNINELPTRSFVLREKAEENNIQKSCRICMEDFKNDELVRTLPCLHFFHRKCIDKWLFQNRTCPICKFDIIQNYDLKELGCM